MMKTVTVALGRPIWITAFAVCVSLAPLAGWAHSSAYSEAHLSFDHHKKHPHRHAHRPLVKRTPVKGIEPREQGPEHRPFKPRPENSLTPSLPPGPETPLADEIGSNNHAPGKERYTPAHRMPGVDMHPSPAGPNRP